MPIEDALVSTFPAATNKLLLATTLINSFAVTL